MTAARALLLYVLLGIALLSGPSAAPIAPRAPGVSAPDRPWDLTRLVLRVHVDPAAGTVAGTASYALARLDAAGSASVLPLRLDQVGLTVTAATVGGSDVPFRVGDRDLVVDLPSAPTVELTVAYRATPRVGMHFRRPGPDSPDEHPEAWSQGEGEENRYWFPLVDHPSDRFVYEGHVTAPPGYVTLTNPEVDLVSYLVVVAVGRYVEHRAGEDSVYLPPGVPDHVLVPILGPIAGMRRHLAERTGTPYPWGPYRQIVV